MNEDDVLLLCLQLADLSPFAIALCFGNNDAQIVAQRKYRMKSNQARQNKFVSFHIVSIFMVLFRKDREYRHSKRLNPITVTKHKLLTINNVTLLKIT